MGRKHRVRVSEAWEAGRAQKTASLEDAEGKAGKLKTRAGKLRVKGSQEQEKKAGKGQAGREVETGEGRREKGVRRAGLRGNKCERRKPNTVDKMRRGRDGTRDRNSKDGGVGKCF